MHSPAQEEALASETASLGLNPETRFYPIRTSWIALLQLILFVSISLFSCCENIHLIDIKSWLKIIPQAMNWERLIFKKSINYF